MTKDVFIAIIAIAYLAPRPWLAWQYFRAEMRVRKAARDCADRAHDECRRQFEMAAARFRIDSPTERT